MLFVIRRGRKAASTKNKEVVQESVVEEPQQETDAPPEVEVVEEQTLNDDLSKAADEESSGAQSANVKLAGTPMASSDSGVESSAEVDVEMKESGCVVDGVASPSDSSSDDINANVNTNSDVDIIICGSCHSQFSLNHFNAFIEHKASRCDSKQTTLSDEILADSPSANHSEVFRLTRRRHTPVPFYGQFMESSDSRSPHSSSANAEMLLALSQGGCRRYRSDATTDTTDLTESVCAFTIPCV
ncbi:unnamed protein product [Anisakis simplex]|uniref:C2H2-type domain-containing protein n=1 Tax=Anisakis simplex TaxID=6269 RepID=A0A0M3KF55_ANISI|nr:unnamed protein product [Anisakis simplex]